MHLLIRVGTRVVNIDQNKGHDNKRTNTQKYEGVEGRVMYIPKVLL